MNKNFKSLSLYPKLIGQLVKGEVTLVDSSGSEVNPPSSVEHLVNESNLGIDGTHDGGNAATDFTDTGETYTAEIVAEGYQIYNVTDGSNAAIDVDSLSGLAGDGGAGNPTADDIAHGTLAGGVGNAWDNADVASIPEVKRFEVQSESHNYMTVEALLDSQDQYNSCYLKIYATLNENADATSDLYWTDITSDVFGTSTVSADGIGDAGRAVTQQMGIIDRPTEVLKYCIKIVAECSNGTQNNEFSVRVKSGG